LKILADKHDNTSMPIKNNPIESVIVFGLCNSGVLSSIINQVFKDTKSAADIKTVEEYKAGNAVTKIWFWK